MFHKEFDFLLRNSASITYFFVGVSGIVTGRGWLSLLALSLLATKAILPNGNSIALWPIGLCTVLGLSYIGYFYLWASDRPGVSYSTARQLFLTQLLIFAVVALFRQNSSGKSGAMPNMQWNWFSVVLVALPVFLVSYATYELIYNPVGLMGGYFAGGDHLNHSGMIYGLTEWTAGSGLRSPFDIYAVPNGLHFLISNVVSISSQSSATPPLAQVFLSAAWFEWIQVAAFIQLGLILIIRKRNELWLFRAFVAFAVIIIMMSVDLLVLHLMWSGFSTSLAITWLILVPVVVLTLKSDEKDFTLVSYFSLVMMIGMSCITWILYQPYAVPFLIVATLLLFEKLFFKIKFFKKYENNFVFFIMPLITATSTFLFVLIPYWLYGNENSFMARLSTNGESYRPSFYLVLFLSLASIWILWSQSEDKRLLPEWRVRRTLLSMQCGFIALAVAVVTVVVLSGDYGIVNQPYYTQKMLWILLFISIPILVGGLLDVVSPWICSLSKPNRRALILTLPILLFLTPTVMGKYPILASQHSSFTWFAKAIRATTDMDPGQTVAYAPYDPQGTFISNLALSIISKNSLDLNVALSGNQYLACRFIASKSISVVYTTLGGKKYLRDSGCPPELLYYEEDTRTDTYRRSHPRLESGILSALESSPSLSEYLDSGFHGSERWVRWSTGLRSTISFSIDVGQANSNIVFGYLAPDALPRPIMAVFTVNGVATKKLSVEQLSSGEVLIPITKETQESGVVDLQINCDWSDEEIRSLDLVTSPPKCLGIRYLGVANKS
jgi:hypothetical protein